MAVDSAWTAGCFPAEKRLQPLPDKKLHRERIAWGFSQLLTEGIAIDRTVDILRRFTCSLIVARALC